MSMCLHGIFERVIASATRRGPRKFRDDSMSVSEGLRQDDCMSEECMRQWLNA